MMETKDLVKRIADVSYLTGEFTLASGKKSTSYFDKYMFESDPLLLQEVAERLARFIPTGTRFLVGMELGSIPLATAVSLQTGIPQVFFRKGPKYYGTAKWIEGPSVAWANVCIIEDVITSGKSVLLAASSLRDAHAYVEDVICVIERNEGNGREALLKSGLRLTSLFQVNDPSPI